ncbi:MAG: hypothetical protein LBR89_02680 [Holosporales bacterium]|nr:hypothetical protein [Holosporales bacterium]
MTIKFFGMCIALATFSQCMQGSDLRHQFNMFNFYEPYDSLADGTRRKLCIDSTGSILNEIVALLPDGVVAIGAIGYTGFSLPLDHLEPFRGQCLMSSFEGNRDFGRVNAEGGLAFVNDLYRTNPEYRDNRQDARNHYIAEGIMAMQRILSSPGFDLLDTTLKATNNLLLAGTVLVVAKTPEDLTLFVETLRKNNDAFERIYKERRDPDDDKYTYL